MLGVGFCLVVYGLGSKNALTSCCWSAVGCFLGIVARVVQGEQHRANP
jgi:hypothetical protein